MNLRKQILTNNDCYKTGAKMTPKGIMVHSTGANNPNLKRYVQPDDGQLGVNGNGNDWNRAQPGGQSVCTHAFIGKLADGSVATYQTLPWDMRGWHAGGTANDSYIGFEICESDLNDAAYFSAVYREAVDLCVHLCKYYFLDVSNVICHSEGCAKGIASNHADVMHWFPMHGKSMETFRADVRVAMAGNAGTSSGTSTVPVGNTYIVGDRVRVRSGVTTFASGTSMASFVKTSLLFVRQVEADKVLVSTQETGDITGWVRTVDLVLDNGESAVPSTPEAAQTPPPPPVPVQPPISVPGEMVYTIGDRVRIRDGVTTFTDGTGMASFIRSASVLYVRQVGDGKVLISTVASGDVTGWVKIGDVVRV